MPRSPRPTLARRLSGSALSWLALTGVVALSTVPARAADLPYRQGPPASFGTPYGGGYGDAGGGGFRVARVPLRPVPIRYDIFGYPLLPGAPDPLATGGGCPAALQPDYDADGNFAGYAPLPMCR